MGLPTPQTYFGGYPGWPSLGPAGASFDTELAKDLPSSDQVLSLGDHLIAATNLKGEYVYTFSLLFRELEKKKRILKKGTRDALSSVELTGPGPIGFWVFSSMLG